MTKKKKKRKIRRTRSTKTIRKRIPRALRAVTAVIVLSSLILGTSFFVKGLIKLEDSDTGLADVVNWTFNRVGAGDTKLGKVAGKFVHRVADTDLNFESSLLSDLSLAEASSDAAASEKQVVYKAAVMADVEDDFENLRRALSMAAGSGLDEVIFLGDFTSFGDPAKLAEAKQTLEAGGLRYHAIPGDHDLAYSAQAGDLSGIKVFGEVFGRTFHRVQAGNVTILVVDNSANYTVMNPDLFNWVKAELANADFVFFSQPLYHPVFSRSMGVIDGEEVAEVKSQADELLTLIRDSEVKAIISADLHHFNRIKDPLDKSLEHITVGALISNREDESIRNLQSPRFSVFTVFEDDTYVIEEVPLPKED